MSPERSRDIAHVGAVELLTAVPEQTADFFVALLGMSETGRAGDSIYLHAWDDYERFTVKVTAPGQLRDRADLAPRGRAPRRWPRRVAAIERAGLGRGWTDGEHGIGATYLFADPDGHEYGIYWDSEWYRPRRGASRR